MIHFSQFLLKIDTFRPLSPTPTKQLRYYNYFIMSVTSKYAQLIHRSNTLFNSGLSYKEHQAEGIQWCVFREKSSQPGAFITDEMGLGKTIIVIMTCLINIKKIHPICSSFISSFTSGNYKSKNLQVTMLLFITDILRKKFPNLTSSLILLY